MARYSKRTLQSAVAATGNGNNLIVEGYGAAGLQITGTFVGTVTFEGTVNETSSTWVAIRGVNRNTGAASTTADGTGIWVFNATGLYAIRARVSAYTSGNITVVGREVDPATAPGELPAAVSNLVTMQSAAAATGDGTALDVLGFGTAALQVSGTFSATITFESTVDGTNWVVIYGDTQATATKTTTAAAAGVFFFNVAGRTQIRARISTYASGNVTVKGYAAALTTPSSYVSITGAVTVTASNTTGNVAHDAADSGNPVKVGFTAESTTPAAVADGDRSNWAGTLYGAGFVNPVTEAGVQITGATGAAVPAGAAMVAGTDGTNLRAIKVDANGVPFVQGEVAHDAADAGNPVKIGGTATAAAPAAVTEGDRVNASFTLAGSQRVEVTAIAAGDTNIGNVDVLTIAAGDNNIGNVDLASAIPAGSAIIGKVGIDQTTPGTTDHVTPTGAVAHDAVNTANPILTGFVAESTIPTAVADGDLSQDAGTLYGARFVNPVTSAGAQVTGATGAAVPAGAVAMGASDGTNLQIPGVVNTNQLKVTNYSPTGVAAEVAAYASDGRNLGANGQLLVASETWLYNDGGGTWDRGRNNVSATLFASAARTATSSSADQTFYNGRGVRVTISATAITDTPSVTFAIEVKDSVSSTYTAILTSAAVTGISTTTLRVAPGITVAANVAVADLLARTWRVTATHGDADSITYSVSADVLL